MGQSFKDLVAWQRSIELTMAIYKLTTAFPASERFGLTNQMRRAAVSVASNIAEGYGRSTIGEYIQFLGHARGSCCELETQIVIAKGLSFGAAESFETTSRLCADEGRLLGHLIKSLQTKRQSGPKSLSPSVP
jgi:four helix bundle protein